MPVLIQDGAGFHLRDGDARLPDNLRIVTVPAYRPELNPVEGLWDQLKDGLCNRVFATLPNLEAVLMADRRRFWTDDRRVRALVFGWWHEIANASSSTIIEGVAKAKEQKVEFIGDCEDLRFARVEMG